MFSHFDADLCSDDLCDDQFMDDMDLWYGDDFNQDGNWPAFSDRGF